MEGLLARHGEGALVDTILEVLDSDCFTPLACNDDFGGVASRVVMNVEADHVYLLAVGTFSPLRRAVEVHVAIAVAPDASIDAGVSTDNGADASRDANAWDTARAPRDPDETPRDGAAVVDAQEHDGGATLTCMGNPGYGCPPSLTCADGAGGVTTVALGCGNPEPGTGGHCVPASGASLPAETCLAAWMSCRGPGGAAWQCPVRWVAPGASNSLVRLPGCCLWNASGPVPLGMCGVAAEDGAGCVIAGNGVLPER